MQILTNMKYVFRLMGDPNVPKWNKGVLLFALVYFFLPIDVIPEAVFPGFGHLDDLLLILGVLNSMKDIFDGYRKNPSVKKDKPYKDISATYQVKDDDAND